MQIAMESVASARGLMGIWWLNRDMLPSPSSSLLVDPLPPRMMMGAAVSMFVVVDVLSFDCDVAACDTTSCAPLFDLHLLLLVGAPPPRAMVATNLAARSLFKLPLPFGYCCNGRSHSCLLVSLCR